MQIWKRLISGNGISLDSQTFENHFQLSAFQNPAYLYNIIGLQRYMSANVVLKEHEQIMKLRFLLAASDDRLDSFTIIVLQKFI